MSVAKATAFLKRHPVLCLLLLTPGIPEYLSGSSPFSAVLLNPAMFGFQLAANLGLYGPGVLLVREAAIRWKKGWASVLLMGAAYGILEEGIGVSTLFDPAAKPVGDFGVYGHWLGVNWVWLASIIPVHMIYSISLPILLLGVALPGTAGVPFLIGRKLGVALAVLGADVLALFLFILLGTHFWMGWPVLVGSLAAIAALVAAARVVGPNALGARSRVPGASPLKLAVVGVLFFPSVIITQSLVRQRGAPPVADFLWVIALQTGFLVYVLWRAGSMEHSRHLVGLAFGLILPIAAFGLLAQISLPLVLVPDVLMVLFFRKLWRATGERPQPRPNLITQRQLECGTAA